MNQEIIDTINYWLQQAWVFLPAVLSFISAFGFPTLLQIAKIVSSTKLFMVQNQKVYTKVNENAELVNVLLKENKDTINEDIQFFTQLKEAIVNQKVKDVIDTRIQTLNARAERLNNVNEITLIKAEEVSQEQLKLDVKEQKAQRKAAKQAAKKVKIKIVEGK